MFRKGVRRLTLGALLVAMLAALAAATGGAAGPLTFVTPTPTYSHDGSPDQNPCPGPGVNERHYCLVLTTYNNLKKSGGVEVDLTLQNYDQSTLSNPVTRLAWDNGDNSGANLALVSTDGPASCSAPSTGGPVVCTFPNLPGLGSSSVVGDHKPCPPLPPGVQPPAPICSTVKLFFSVNATEPKVSFTATADVKESQPNGANVDQQRVAADMLFGTDGSQDATIALPGGSSELDAPARKSSVTFKGGSAPFLAQLQAIQENPTTPGVCFPGINCTGLTLTTDLHLAPTGTFSATNPILWTAVVAANNTNVIAVHNYDAVSLTSSAPNTLSPPQGTSFANCDGVTFEAGKTPIGLQPAPQVYFVVKATNTSFQVASSATGKPLTFSGSAPFSGSCIRIIGDQKTERFTGCPAVPPTPPAPAPAVVPAICAAKINNSTVQVYLYDSANGGVHI
jgi:hypothetical protein